MLAHVEPSAFSRSMSATTAQRSCPSVVLAPAFSDVAWRPWNRFVTTDSPAAANWTAQATTSASACLGRRPGRRCEMCGTGPGEACPNQNAGQL